MTHSRARWIRRAGQGAAWERRRERLVAACPQARVLVLVVARTVRWAVRWLLLLLSLLGACVAPPAERGIPLIPDAVVDVAFAELGPFAELVSRLAGAGVLPAETALLQHGGLKAGGVAAPIVVTLRESGEVVVASRLVDAARFQAALASCLPAGVRLERRFGHVDAAVDATGSVLALIRADDGLVFIVASPVDGWGAATLIEALGTGALATPRRAPTGTQITGGPALGHEIGGVEGLSGTVDVDGGDLHISLAAHLSGALADLASGLSSSSPAFSCVVEDGAAIALRLPPLGAQALAGLVDADAGHLDGFEGRVVLALHEPPPGTPVIATDRATWASIVVAGRPRDGGAAGLRETLASAGPAAVARTVGARAVQDIHVADKPWRQVSAVVDDDVFALAVGAPVIVDRVAVGSTCAQAPRRLLFVDGPRLLRIVGRAAPELPLLRSLGVDAAVLPATVRALTAIERLEVAAGPPDAPVGAQTDVVNVDIVLKLRPEPGQAR